MNLFPGLDDVVAVARAHAARVDREAVFPEEGLQSLREAGLMGIFVPEEQGGLGTDVHAYAHTAQALAAACMSTASVWTMHAFQVDALARFGQAELCRELLPRIAAGGVYIASVTAEPTSGSDLFTADAALVADGDGAATFRRDAPVVTGARRADGFLITLRAGRDARPHEVTLVYADRDRLKVVEQTGWDSLGVRGTESVAVALEGVVPQHNIVGEPGQFRTVASESMVPLSHIGWAACWLGAARGAFVELIGWLRDPNRRSGPDVRSDLVREQLARIRADLELVSAYLSQTCDQVASARASGESLAGQHMQLRLNVLKLAASELMFRAADRMVQLGGLSVGYSRSAPIPLERHFRDLRAASLNHSNTRLWPATGALTLLDSKVTLSPVTAAAPAEKAREVSI